MLSAGIGPLRPPVRERVLGPEHPDTLAARRSFADFTGEAGDYRLARNLMAELLATCERVFGPDDPATLAVRSNLTYWAWRADEGRDSRDRLPHLRSVA